MTIRTSRYGMRGWGKAAIVTGGTGDNRLGEIPWRGTVTGVPPLAGRRAG